MFPPLQTACAVPAAEEMDVRIISGSARGRQLSRLCGADIRPTPDRVREALFSMLNSRLGSLAGLHVLDLFAGSGALALEALSRGAASATLIDQGAQAARVIPANIKTCAMQEQATFIRSDVQKALLRLAGNFYDLVFLDPPYGQDLVPPVLTSLTTLKLLAPEGLICAETDRRDVLSETIGPLVRVDLRYYGTTTIHLFTYADAEA